MLEETSAHRDDAVVYILDDDQQTRTIISLICRSVGLPSIEFERAQDFWENHRTDLASCLVLDVRLPDGNGLEVLRELKRRDMRMPVIMVTGYGEVPMAVDALQQGAFDFVPKPFSNQQLLQRIERAIESDRERRATEARRAQRQQGLDTLSAREREVLDRVVAGQTTKQIAEELGISVKTVDHYRVNVMRKLDAHNIVELVRLVLDDNFRDRKS